MVRINLHTLPAKPDLPALAPAGAGAYDKALAMIRQTSRIVIKAGGGTRGHDDAVRRLAEATGAAVVLSPGSTGILPDDHPQNMHVGGSKGSISGNYAMENAELLIAIGTRAVCQADCSGVGYPCAKAVININGDLADLTHYANTTGLAGDITAVIDALLSAAGSDLAPDSGWLSACARQKEAWAQFKAERYRAEPMEDDNWQRPVLTQPAAIKIAADFAKSINAAKYFDAGDVQANGFQIVEDDRTGDTFTEAGAS